MNASLKHSLSLLLLLATATSAVPQVDDNISTIEEQVFEQESSEKLTRFQRINKWAKEHKIATIAMLASLVLVTETAVEMARGEDPLVKRGYKALVGEPAQQVYHYTGVGSNSNQPFT